MIPVVLSGLVAALLAPLLHRSLPRWAGWLCALLPLSLFGWLVLQIGAVSDGQLLQSSQPWLPSLGITLSFRLDGLGLLFALLITGIGTLVVLYASSYLHEHPHLPPG